MIDLMDKYNDRGKTDSAIRVGQEWLKSHPNDAPLVYQRIGWSYLVKARAGATHKDELIRQAVEYLGKALSVNSTGRGFEIAGDLSTADNCLYYGRALRALADEESWYQGDFLPTTSGVTIPQDALRSLRLENKESQERVQAKFARADCK